MNAGGTIHRFTERGLGAAPFRVVGNYMDIGPKPTADGGMIGSPGQPMGVCDYCGTGIANVFVIRSKDEKEFRVGSDCVLKVGDEGLKKVVREALAKTRAEQTHRRNRAMLDELQQLINDMSVRAILTTTPDPTGRNASMLERALWYWENAGTTGKKLILREIKTVLDKHAGNK